MSFLQELLDNIGQALSGSGKALNQFSDEMKEFNRKVEEDIAISKAFQDLRINLELERLYLKTLIVNLESYHQSIKLAQYYTDEESRNCDNLFGDGNFYDECIDPVHHRNSMLEHRIRYSPQQFSCPSAPNSKLTDKVNEHFLELMKERENFLNDCKDQLSAYHDDFCWLQIIMTQNGAEYLIERLFPENK